MRSLRKSSLNLERASPSDSLTASLSSGSESEIYRAFDVDSPPRCQAALAICSDISRASDGDTTSTSEVTPRKRKRTAVSYVKGEPGTAPETPAKHHKATSTPASYPTGAVQTRRPNPYHQEAMLAMLSCAAAWAEAVDLLVKARQAQANQRPKRRNAGLHPRNNYRMLHDDLSEDEVEPVAALAGSAMFTAAPPVPLWSVS